MYEVEDVVIVDDDDYEYDDYRNARPAVRAHASRGRRVPVRRRRPRARSVRTGRAIIRRQPESQVESGNTGSIIRKDTGGLSTGQLVQAGAQLLAAIQPLPPKPAPTGEAAPDVANMVLYQSALAEHAKRDEQLRTVGQLVAKLFA